MKRFILSLVFVFVATFGFAQAPHMNRFEPIDFNKYEMVDSLPIERIMIHFEKEIDNEDFIDLGSGDYMAPVPHKDNMVIRLTSDKTKAIVVYNSYCFGRHLEFNVEENDRRVILWYKDKNLYCGYVYDKEFKIAVYYESKKEFKRFTQRPLFNRPFNFKY